MTRILIGLSFVVLVSYSAMIVLNSKKGDKSIADFRSGKELMCGDGVVVKKGNDWDLRRYQFVSEENTFFINECEVVKK